MCGESWGSWYITHLLNTKIENSSFLGDKDNNYQCNTWRLPFKTAVFSGHRIFSWNRFASFSMQTETWKWSKTYLKIYCGLNYTLEWISVWSFSSVNHTQKNIEKKLILYPPIVKNCVSWLKVVIIKNKYIKLRQLQTKNIEGVSVCGLMPSK